MAAADGNDPKGLYATLQVVSSADIREIRKSYRTLALRWHPDKNPDDPEATAEFQKISAAYEVLSDPERRHLYDSTGCTDAQEFEESDDLQRASDIFAAFFGGLEEDLDPGEQAMLEEFLRMAGSSAFRRKPRGRKRGRGVKGRSRANRADEEKLEEVFMAAMDGVVPSVPAPAPACPQGHSLKRRRADAEYECDVCHADIVTGKRLFYCRKCDYSICQKCYKAAEAEAADAFAEEEGQECDEEELVETFCQMIAQPVLQGHRLCFVCELCGHLCPTQPAATFHMKEKHMDEIQSLLQMAREEGTINGPSASAASAFNGVGLESLFMAAASLDDLFGDCPSGTARPKGPRRSKKKR